MQVPINIQLSDATEWCKCGVEEDAYKFYKLFAYTEGEAQL